ncbi:MAG: PIN domain-containing protein [Desulfobacterales bacterium]|uniref:PIN domain-containing protein n=1 Tax=Candidatus Desulfatibia profunda TaxID=2841695 RepID=A0A8J6NK46_9BACT|nr:PIN domain-containing protein [Candidatus Desulfatibia profunda]MBL7179185.1 PIN domain-containing protein [Desulfobacterales bacterium]MBU0698208.1 PIN domain-containing protein [Pseudomonadota bacterium]
MNASKLSLHYNLPMADSIILATAKAYDCTIWTQDADFKNIPGVKFFSKK